MPKKISRRSFIKSSATLGAATVLGAGSLAHFVDGAVSSAFAADAVDICAVKGSMPFIATQKAIEKIGGIDKYITKNSVVGVLANAVRNTKGANVNPDTLLAVIDYCYMAGAKIVRLIRAVPHDYWTFGTVTRNKEYEEMLKSITSSGGDFVPTKIEGVIMKEAHYESDMLECDHFINVGIAKHHTGTHFTGTLKNMMGACPHNPTNRFCHMGHGTDPNGFYEDVNFLSQCIADLNTVRTPDFCVMDATTFLLSNGPFGPGDTKSANTVVAGVNPVSIDAYCTRFIDRTPDEIAMIGFAAKHKIGTDDLTKQKILELTV
ncbi:MAG: DUF362 domain-containing protein [Candidatus Zixiibacteriota bacterium]